MYGHSFEYSIEGVDKGEWSGKYIFCQEEAGQGNLNMASPYLLWANYNRIT